MEAEVSILYELICCAEWSEDKEAITPFPSLSTCESGLLSYLNPSTFFRNQPFTPSETALWIKSAGPSWLFAVASDGKIIAVLQDTMLETRSSRDNFSSVIGKIHIPKDEFPNFRKLAWSKDSSLLAVSFTNGLIVCFDIMASQMFSVRRFDTANIDDGAKLPFSIDHGLVGLFFVEERLKKTTYCSELVTVDKRGIIKSFRQINPDEMKYHHEGSFRQFYPFGVTDAQYSDSQSIILVAGSLLQESHAEKSNVQHGITAWRLLLDHPYYRILFAVDGDEFRMDARRLWRMAFTLTTAKQQKQESIMKMVLSPNGNQMAAIHVSGTISIWKIPSLKLSFLWPLKAQFQYSVANPRFNYRWRSSFNQSQHRSMDHLLFHPYDINWWDEESIIISRTNGAVTLVPICDCPSKNLLGDLPELFESPVRVSSRFEKIFFVLEAEVRQKGSNGENSELTETGESWLKSASHEILFWVTDIERFRPPRKRRKKLPCWTHSYRIFTLRNITPQELFYRKIEHEEYGEALDLAKLYKLDPDLVYQRQWTKSPVSIHSIKDFLAKITKRNWVLQECLDRVPETIDAARELLKFGLKGTDLTVAVLISQGKDKGKFILWTPDDLEMAKEEYMSLVDVDNAEVVRLLRYRKRFLHFMDILDTYEEIVGGPRMVEERYNSKSYGRLRSRNTIESAIEMTQNCDTNGLRILLTNHWADVSAHYLDVISSFPETWSPHDYKEFLPTLDEEGNATLWKDVASKNLDWCDEFVLKSDNILNQSASECELNREDIYIWYEKRIREIESLSGIINYALDLGLLGIERNVMELRPLVQDLHTLETLIYEVQVDDMTLSILKSMSDMERIALLLSKSTDETFVSDFRYYVLPFIANCENSVEGSGFQLLNDYLTSICSKDLSWVLKIFEASHEDEFDPLIPDAKELMLLAHNCIYKCENTEETANVLAILACLPEKGYAKKSSSMENLHTLLEEVQAHFRGVQLIQKYHVSLTVDRMKRISQDESQASQEDLLINICQSASIIHPPLKISDWKTLLSDLLEIRNKLFKTFQIEKCFEIYVLALLKSGSPEVIKLTKDFLEKSPPGVPANPKVKSNPISPEYSPVFSLYLHIIPYCKALDMIIDAAELYFDASSNYADSDMELCKICLNLIQNSKEPRVALMFDLLDAVKLMNKDFRLNILPRAVRICQDRLDLIRHAGKKSNNGYKKIQQLLKLVILLHIEGMSLEAGECFVLEMTGDAALVHGDVKLGIQICQTIMAKGYSTAWNIFVQLAEHQSDPPLLDPLTRSAFINYALSICPDSEILTVLSVSYLIEIQSLQTELKDFIPGGSVIDMAKLEIRNDEHIIHQTLKKLRHQHMERRNP